MNRRDTDRFNDPRSRAQVAVYQANRLLGADERNERNRARWNKQCRAQWELEHVGPARTRAQMESTP
jgi:hypothetical protein